MTGRGIVLALAALAAAAAGTRPAMGQEATGGGQAARCSDEAYRGFDFWLGEWEVRTPSGQVAGRNRITSILSGCAIKEEWTGSRGSIGTSYNTWDAASRRWHQTWVDDQGTLLLLDGGLEDGKMVLSGERTGPNGGVVRHRLTWQPLEGGTVRQLWESSSDDGATWKTVFDGTYHRTQ